MKKFIILSITLLTLLSASIKIVHADPSSGLPTGGQNGAQDKPIILGNPLENMAPKDTPIPELIARVIKGALGIVGSLALVMFIYGGFTWMTAAGSAERVTTGMHTVLWAAQ